jgi:hypothetical protein
MIPIKSSVADTQKLFLKEFNGPKACFQKAPKSLSHRWLPQQVPSSPHNTEPCCATIIIKNKSVLLQNGCATIPYDYVIGTSRFEDS